jgi:tetratricopeptide (TPR) repeat protein
MKQWLWMVAILFLETLSACGVHPPVTSQTSVSVATIPLQTASEYLRRGDNFSAAQDYSHAILDYDQAIRLNPNFAEAYNNRGFASYWSGNYEQAIADYSRAIALRPAYAYAYNNRGAAYMASGHSNQAISDFDHALALQPDFPQAYINRGNANLRLGHLGLALADFRRGGVNLKRTVALLCSIPTFMTLLGILVMKIVARHTITKRRLTIEKKRCVFL